MSSTLAGFSPQLQQVLDDLVEVLRVQDLLVERRVQLQLGVQLQPADAREVVLLRVEEHVLEERSRAVERRRIARPQAAVDLDQRFFVRVDRILLQRRRSTEPISSRSGKKISSVSTFFSCAIEMTRGVELLVGLEDHFAGRRIDDVGRRRRRLRARRPTTSTALDARLLQRGDRVRGDLLARVRDRRRSRP